jgi:membrane protease YdiL (CAAX protease family)
MTWQLSWAPVLGGLVLWAGLYAWNLYARDPISEWLTRYSRLTREVPWRSAMLIIRVPLYGAPGIVVYVVARLVWPEQTLPFTFDVGAAVSGLVLGVALFLACSTLANAVFAVAYRIVARGRPGSSVQAELRRAKDSGWIRAYTLAHQHLPWWGFLAVTTISVAGEEMAFRGLLMPLLVNGFGTVAGFVLTLVAFVGIQRLYMPSWLGALVPSSGALIIGLVLGYLGLTERNVLPLVCSHLGFFVATTVTLLAPAASGTVPRTAAR